MVIIKSRQVRFKELFIQQFQQLKEKHGHGKHSWAEGITRKSARRIARVKARKIMVEQSPLNKTIADAGQREELRTYDGVRS